MNCTDVVGYLSPYLDSELDPTTTFLIQSHLSGCQACRERFDEESTFERRISGSLRLPKSPPDAVWGSLLAQAMSTASPAKAHDSRWRMFRERPSRNFWPLLVAALMFLFFATLIGFGLRHLHMIDKRRQPSSLAEISTGLSVSRNLIRLNHSLCTNFYENKCYDMDTMIYAI